MLHETFQLAGSKNELIRGEIKAPEGDEKLPVVVICHGFKGFKDWGFFPYLASQLAEKGFAAVTFNFSHNGIGEDPEQLSELDKFEQNTLSYEAEDLKQVVEAIVSEELPLGSRLDAKRIGVLGHSRGAYSVIVAGGSENSVKAIATLAGIAHPPEVSESDEQNWRAEGRSFVKNARTGQELPLGVNLLDDMLANKDSIQKAASSLNKPLLIIHGTADEAVPISHAHLIKDWAPEAELKIIEGAGHTFSVVHPFVKTTDDFDAVLSYAIEHFNTHL